MILDQTVARPPRPERGSGAGEEEGISEQRDRKHRWDPSKRRWTVLYGLEPLPESHL